MSRNRRGSSLTLVALMGVALIVAGCRQQMADQPSYKPLDSSDFFSNGQSARPVVPDTVSRSAPTADDPFYTGQVDGMVAATIPMPVTMPVTMAVLQRGQERYNIFCAVCHDRVGTGNGIIVQRGFPQPPSFNTDEFREDPVGHFFDVITNGFGEMPAYAHQIPASDRWAIIVYIRALQLSQDAPLTDVPSNEQRSLKGTTP